MGKEEARRGEGGVGRQVRDWDKAKNSGKHVKWCAYRLLLQRCEGGAHRRRVGLALLVARHPFVKFRKITHRRRVEWLLLKMKEIRVFRAWPCQRRILPSHGCLAIAQA
jgi:hypothetical protein